MLEFVSRSHLCEMVGVEYNHFNQYLGKSSKKSIGAIFAARICLGLNLPADWLDVVRSKYMLANALGMSLKLDKGMLRGDRIHLIDQLYGVPFCDLNESLPLSSVKCDLLEQLKPALASWSIFKIMCPLDAKVFPNSIICCSDGLSPGTQSLFLFEDGAVIFAEYIYHRDGYMNLVDQSGVRRDFSMEGLIYKAKIELVLQLN